MAESPIYTSLVAAFADPDNVADPPPHMGYDGYWSQERQRSGCRVVTYEHELKFRNSKTFNWRHTGQLFMPISLDIGGRRPISRDEQSAIITDGLGQLPKVLIAIVLAYFIRPMFTINIKSSKNIIYSAPVYELPFTGFPNVPLPICGHNHVGMVITGMKDRNTFFIKSKAGVIVNDGDVEDLMNSRIDLPEWNAYRKPGVASIIRPTPIALAPDEPKI